ncbi:unnamed protein product [Diatraea saccharalis]|uniref:NADP-dependent oxidoreductase domain-containing protein n=1 Tax=Diatraea saccharalis TaxID=40085 RepID=A0A9N9WGQ1_9NEOP|nr:unnamed protein product [Diatraea saccharalis]
MAKKFHVWRSAHGLGTVLRPTTPLEAGPKGYQFQKLAVALAQGRVVPKGDEVEKAVELAIDLGYRHIDTAYIYKVEDQVGRALTQKMAMGIKREELFITTKLWNDRHAREAVVPALRESLQALNLSYVDLYLIHWPVGQFANLTFDYTDYLETWRGMMDAKQLGLTKSIGLSNFNQHQIDRILDNGLDVPAVLQVEINLNLQQPDLLSYCKTKSIVVMGYTPFGSLFYSKARADAPPPRIDDPQLTAIGNNHNKTVTQITLRYMLDLGVIPIPKALSYDHLASNIDVFDFNLTESEQAILKRYDRGYRTIPQLKWIRHPYYPFEIEKNNN